MQLAHVPVLLGLAALSTSCGGLATVTDQCLGPYCGLTCEDNDDCPEASWCLLNHCTTGSRDGGNVGGDGGGGSGDGGSGDTGSDGGGGSGDDSGDGGGSGDGGSGDAPWGDTLVQLGDGVSCNDPDQDGYCECCPLGPDCDETNAAINPGAVEICDGIDNNGIDDIDEGVLNPCGNCQGYPECNTDDPWTGGSGVDPGDLPPPVSSEDGTILEDDDGDGFGSVTLATGTVATDFAWPASQTEGTISRIDTIANIEVGRYIVVLVRDEDAYRPYVTDFGPTSQCQQASRSTIDEHGNAYIANRACSGYGGNCQPNRNTLPNSNGSVTKIGFLNDVLCDAALNPGLDGCQCVDRNSNGSIETSHDWDAAADGSGANGIQRPVCTGGNCGTSCTEDVDCPANRYCVRELYPSQPQGQCSDSAPSIAPCTGDQCATTCTRHSSCPTSHFCVRDRTNPNQRFCSERPETPELLGKDDECVLWTRRIPGNDHTGNATLNNDNLLSRPRAMAIDKDGYIWVGDWDRSRVYKLSPQGEFVDPVADATPINQVCQRVAHRVSDGSLVANPATTCLSERCYFLIPNTCRITMGLQPYGAVVDSGRSHPNHFGYLWIAARSGDIQRIDTETGATTVVYDNSEDSYGVTIDQHDRVWVADAGADSAPNLHRFDPAHTDFDVGSSCANCWTKFVVDGPTAAPWNASTGWRGRGITTELLTDGSARIWAIFNNDWWGTPNYLVAFEADSGVELTGHRVRLDTSAIAPTTGPGCVAPAGVGIGYGGKVWSVNRDTASVCAYDPANPFEPLASASMGPSPYTYSDFTGNLFRSFTKPQGYYRLLVQGCPLGYEIRNWGVVSWDADIPGTSTLEVRFRAGSTIGRAQVGAQIGPVIQPPDTEFELPFATGDEWLQIEFLFIADDDGLAPKLHHVDVARQCREVGGG